MSSEHMILIIHEFLFTSLLLVAPAVATSLVVGLVIAIFQTVTSIQEQTLTFAPRIVAVAIVIALTLTWSMNLLIAFTEKLFTQMSGIVT